MLYTSGAAGVDANFCISLAAAALHPVDKKIYLVIMKKMLLQQVYMFILLTSAILSACVLVPDVCHRLEWDEVCWAGGTVSILLQWTHTCQYDYNYALHFRFLPCTITMVLWKDLKEMIHYAGGSVISHAMNFWSQPGSFKKATYSFTPYSDHAFQCSRCLRQLHLSSTWFVTHTLTLWQWLKHEHA